MNFIQHAFDIQAPREKVFTSITTADGLSSWWTTEVQADEAKVGALYHFTFRGPSIRNSGLPRSTRPPWCPGRASAVTTPGEPPRSASNSNPLMTGPWSASGTRWVRKGRRLPSLQQTSTGATTSTACGSSASGARASRIDLVFPRPESAPPPSMDGDTG